ncbi:MAG: class I SAM-dependent methyltransferase [Vicinamibacterales bacterium]
MRTIIVTAAVVAAAASVTTLGARQAPSPTHDPQPQEMHGQKPGQPMGHMEHRFDDPERFAKSFDDPARDAWQMPDRVIAALGLTPGQKVADIGAGTGYFSVRLARSAARPTVFAVDLEPKMVEHLTHRAAAEALPNMRAVQAGPSSPNLPEPVDVVLVVDTYHHIPNRPAYFAALRSHLTSGGRVAIVDFRKDAGGEGPPAEFRFTPEQISGEMAQAGYVLDAQHEFLPRQLFLVYRVK